MRLSILLDSQLAKQQKGVGTQRSHDFTIRFDEPIFLDKKR